MIKFKASLLSSTKGEAGGKYSGCFEDFCIGFVNGDSCKSEDKELERVNLFRSPPNHVLIIKTKVEGLDVSNCLVSSGFVNRKC